MARLIDADQINYHEHTECMWRGDFETVRTVTDKEIAEIPTVETVEVVRCLDCKHLMFSDYYGECGEGHMGIVSPDDFCSYGERKDGDGNG